VLSYKNYENLVLHSLNP